MLEKIFEKVFLNGQGMRIFQNNNGPYSGPLILEVDNVEDSHVKRWELKRSELADRVFSINGHYFVEFGEVSGKEIYELVVNSCNVCTTKACCWCGRETRTNSVIFELESKGKGGWNWICNKCGFRLAPGLKEEWDAKWAEFYKETGLTPEEHKFALEPAKDDHES